MRRFNIITLLIVIFTIIGCGPDFRYKRYKKNNPVPQAKYIQKMEIDSAMIPLFEEWLNDCYNYDTEPKLGHIKYIKFTDTLRSDYAGLSTKEGILIQDIYKNKKECKVLFYHEMAHCSFMADHDTVNTGIMAPYFSPFVANIYLNRWEHYLESYFNFIKESKK